MSERGLPIAEGANACPFVAFEDDRDERATVPDHRHRCYAEVRPAPRALAHQEAYCLSSAFPVCPTFQDWARRESARARDAAAGAAAAAAGESAAPSSTPLATSLDPAPSPRPTGLDDDLEAPDAAAAFAGPVPAVSVPAEDTPITDPDPDEDDRRYEPDDEPEQGARRNPPRDWSAPPPWLASAEGVHPAPSDPPDFLADRSNPARGLAGSAADLLAGGSPPRSVPPPLPPRAQPPADLGRRPINEPDVESEDLPRPAVPPRRPRAYDQHLGGPSTGPDWERPRRYEAYPTIKTRMGLPAIPRLAGMAIAVALLAVALFFLPALLGLGAGEGPAATKSPVASPSRSIAPTATPVATPVSYLIKKGDTLSKVAVAHGITLEELLAANPTIKNPNRITEGQQITIPAPSAAIPDEFGGSAAPSSEASP